MTHSESRGDYHYAVALGDRRFLEQPFIIGLELDTVGDPRDHVTGAMVWDKAEGESKVACIEFLAP